MIGRVAGAIALLVVCLIVAVVAALWMAVAVTTSAPRGWRLAISFDQLGNAMAGGDEDEVFSSRCWRYRDHLPYRWLQPAIDWVFARFGDQDHCRRSFNAELTRLLNRGWIKT